MKNFTLSAAFLLFLGSFQCFAQYPKISPEVQAQSKVIMDAAEKRSDEAWEKALVIIEEEAKHGKPFIPWASRPNDYHRQIFLHFLVLKEEECTLLVVVAEIFTRLQA